MAENNESSYDNDVALARLAAVDSKAEEILLRRLYPRMYQVALAVLGNQWLADDAAQLAALQVLKSLGSFNGIGSLESWAGCITYRTSIKVAKKERTSIKMQVPFEDETTPSADGMEKSISQRNLFENLVHTMDNIPQKRRVPLLLHLACGYTVGEVAKLTEVSPNTVKDRLRTAYKEMRVIMKDHPTLWKEILEEVS